MKKFWRTGTVFALALVLGILLVPFGSSAYASEIDEEIDEQIEDEEIEDEEIEDEEIEDDSDDTDDSDDDDDSSDHKPVTWTDQAPWNSIISVKMPDAVSYVPYSENIQKYKLYEGDLRGRTYFGKLPAGMTVLENGELYGIPKETGTFIFTVLTVGDDNVNALKKVHKLTVVDNTDYNVAMATDAGYELIGKVDDRGAKASDSISDLHHEVSYASSFESYKMESKGELDYFKNVYLDGDVLVEGVDYTAERGSTLLTIRAQTLKAKAPGRHTLCMVYRDKSGALKRAAQNFDLVGEQSTVSNVSEASAKSDKTASYTSASELNTSPAPSEAETAETPSADGLWVSIPYTIQKKDTLWKISKDYYGTGVQWGKIYKDNSTVIQDPDVIYEGQNITINNITSE